MDGKIMNASEFIEIIDKLVKNVIEYKIEVEINITPDNIQIQAQPWKPFEMKCPYGKE